MIVWGSGQAVKRPQGLSTGKPGFKPLGEKSIPVVDSPPDRVRFVVELLQSAVTRPGLRENR